MMSIIAVDTFVMREEKSSEEITRRIRVAAEWQR